MDVPKEPSNEDWVQEAKAVINDIKDHVLDAFVSKTLPSSCQRIFINLKTLEGNQFCVLLTCKGFEVVGDDYDKTTLTEQALYETPYSLLQSISPQYVSSFGETLMDRLKSLENNK